VAGGLALVLLEPRNGIAYICREQHVYLPHMPAVSFLAVNNVQLKKRAVALL
jgi:hypothetical protein